MLRKGRKKERQEGRVASEGEKEASFQVADWKLRRVGRTKGREVLKVRVKWEDRRWTEPPSPILRATEARLSTCFSCSWMNRLLS